MSGASIVPIIAAIAASSAAAAAARKKREEEEKMTKYNSDDLDGWEFKIFRANTRKFKTHEMVEKVRLEEAKAGWELVEKFDDYRLRFKRRVEKRSMDKHLEIDPYRSQLAAPKGRVIAAIAAGLILLVGLLVSLGVRFGFDRGVIEGLTIPGMILILIAGFGLVAAVVAVRKRSD